ncbi:MAG: ABC transporter permease subunit [Deltaproteobacteria bacterium]|nr:ABC transporter permease subunit [Deltaproteobacteria bacterium]
MNGAVAIVKKELRSYFYSPVAYVIMGVFLFVMGVIFAKFVAIYEAYNRARAFGQAQGITLDKLALYMYQNMAFILCFVTPFLTMKLFAEERRQQTFELLLTAPLRGVELVLGKFISAYILMVLMVGLSFIYVVFMILWGNPEMGIIFSTYIGLLLALACYISLGALISAMTSSQAIAAVWTFIVLLLLWLLQSLGQGVTTKWGFIDWGPTLVYISPLGHFNSFAEGLIHIKDVIYFLTFTIFMLFLTHRVVESNRWR